MTASYLNDLLDQPSALQATLDSLSKALPIETINQQLKKGIFKQVILTGMGSSYHGLYPLQLRLFGSSFPVIRLETAELIHYAKGLIHPDNLIVAVSQSGQSVEVVKLLELVNDQVTLIGVTNTPGSALAERASVPIITRAGEEVSVSCKTYISALAALTWLGDQLKGEPEQFPTLMSLPPMLAEYWSGWQSWVDKLCQRLAGVEHLFLLGRGTSLAAVNAGALIIKEAARFAAEGMHCAAFRHGPLEVITPHTFALVYLGAEATSVLNVKMAQDIQAAGGQAEVVGMGIVESPFQLPDCPVAALPILEIETAQMVSLALAQLKGIEAGKFVHASKVTATE